MEFDSTKMLLAGEMAAKPDSLSLTVRMHMVD